MINEKRRFFGSFLILTVNPNLNLNRYWLETRHLVSYNSIFALPDVGFFTPAGA